MADEETDLGTFHVISSSETHICIGEPKTDRLKIFNETFLNSNNRNELCVLTVHNKDEWKSSLSDFEWFDLRMHLDEMKLIIDENKGYDFSSLCWSESACTDRPDRPDRTDSTVQDWFLDFHLKDTKELVYRVKHQKKGIINDFIQRVLIPYPLCLSIQNLLDWVCDFVNKNSVAPVESMQILNNLCKFINESDLSILKTDGTDSEQVRKIYQKILHYYQTFTLPILVSNVDTFQQNKPEFLQTDQGLFSVVALKQKERFVYASTEIERIIQDYSFYFLENSCNRPLFWDNKNKGCIQISPFISDIWVTQKSLPDNFDDLPRWIAKKDVDRARVISHYTHTIPQKCLENIKQFPDLCQEWQEITSLDRQNRCALNFNSFIDLLPHLYVKESNGISFIDFMQKDDINMCLRTGETINEDLDDSDSNEFDLYGGYKLIKDNVLCFFKGDSIDPFMKWNLEPYHLQWFFCCLIFLIPYRIDNLTDYQKFGRVFLKTDKKQRSSWWYWPHDEEYNVHFMDRCQQITIQSSKLCAPSSITIFRPSHIQQMIKSSFDLSMIELFSLKTWKMVRCPSDRKDFQPSALLYDVNDKLVFLIHHLSPEIYRLPRMADLSDFVQTLNNTKISYVWDQVLFKIESIDADKNLITLEQPVLHFHDEFSTSAQTVSETQVYVNSQILQYLMNFDEFTHDNDESIASFTIVPFVENDHKLIPVSFQELQGFKQVAYLQMVGSSLWCSKSFQNFRKYTLHQLEDNFTEVYFLNSSDEETFAFSITVPNAKMFFDSFMKRNSSQVLLSENIQFLPVGSDNIIKLIVNGERMTIDEFFDCKFLESHKFDWNNKIFKILYLIKALSNEKSYFTFENSLFIVRCLELNEDYSIGFRSLTDMMDAFKTVCSKYPSLCEPIPNFPNVKIRGDSVHFVFANNSDAIIDRFEFKLQNIEIAKVSDNLFKVSSGTVICYTNLDCVMKIQQSLITLSNCFLMEYNHQDKLLSLNILSRTGTDQRQMKSFVCHLPVKILKNIAEQSKIELVETNSQ